MSNEVTTSDYKPKIEYRDGFVMLQQKYNLKVATPSIYFWLVRFHVDIAGTTLADSLVIELGYDVACYIFFPCFCATMLTQLFYCKYYYPPIFWLCVLFASGCTFLIEYPIPYHHDTLWMATCGFGVLLAGAFGIWYDIERSLDIYNIYNLKRESLYWFAVFCCFLFSTAVMELTEDYIHDDVHDEEIAFDITWAIFFFLFLFVCGLWCGGYIHPVAGFWSTFVLAHAVAAAVAIELVLTAGDLNATIITLSISIVLVTIAAYESILKVEKRIQDFATTHIMTVRKYVHEAKVATIG